MGNIGVRARARLVAAAVAGGTVGAGLGSTFNAPDLLWYAVGAAAAALAHMSVTGRRAAPERRPGVPRAAVGGRWRAP